MRLKILLDQNAPLGLRRALAAHEVVASAEMGWERLVNGDLIRAAEASGFVVMITCDRNIRYQQNLSGRTISLIELSTGLWPAMRDHLALILTALDAVAPGSYSIVEIPRAPLRRRPYPRLDQ